MEKVLLTGYEPAAPDLRCNLNNQNGLSEVWFEGGMPIKLQIAKDLMAARITGLTYSGATFIRTEVAIQALDDAKVLIAVYNNS